MQQADDVYSLEKQGRPAASPTSVLEDPLVIGSWSMWDPSLPIDPPNTSHYAAPICTSPLRYSMSSPLRDAVDLAPKLLGHERDYNSHSTGSGRSLVETLQNCLTSLPQSTNMGARGGNLLGEVTTPPRQLSSRGPGKRRQRASQRAPTRILETNRSEFKDMVQKLTGIPSGNPGSTLVRPSPTHSVRPETLRSIRCLPPISSPPRPATVTPSPITFLQHLQRNNNSPMDAAMAPRALKREFLEEWSSSPLYDSHESAMKRATSAPTTSMESWWSDNDNSRGPLNSEPGSLTMSSGDPLTNTIISAASGTIASQDFGRLDSADGQLAQEEQDFSFCQIEIESWLSAQDHTSAESMRGGDA